MLAVLNIVASAATVTFSRSSLTFSAAAAIVAGVGVAMLTLAGFASLALFDNARRRGNSMYDSLSVFAEDALTRKQRSELIDLRVRMTMSDYLRAAQIPVIASDSAPTILFVVNVGALLLVAWGLTIRG
jgi:hypothetical protein